MEIITALVENSDPMKRKENPQTETPQNKKEKELTDEEAQEIFNQELDEIEKKTGKVHIILGFAKKRNDETLLETLRKVDRLLVDKSFPTIADAIDMKIREELDIDSDAGFVMTTTASSYPFFSIWEDEYKIISKQSDKKLKALHALALTITFLNYEYWYRDTDVPEEVEKIAKQMNTIWTDIFSWSNEESGLDNYEPIKGMMNTLATKLEESSYDVDFPCLDGFEGDDEEEEDSFEGDDDEEGQDEEDE